MKALIAMSGGVDSSVAAYLTQKQGLTCIGCTMKLYENRDAGLSCRRTCCSLEDTEDARSVAYRLGMPYYVFNFTQSFRQEIMEKFVHSYLAGLTPNPCIDCNRCLKFDRLYQRARTLGCQYVVTGHYARIGHDGSRYVLKKALDETKDQSYVLYSLTQEQLAHTLFPLGALHKAEVRQIAQEQGFLNAQKPDSQDICFVPDGDYAAFIERYTGAPCPAGDFVDRSGRVLGRHRGIIRYTIGQHRGLGLSSPEPLYVCGIDPQANTVQLGHRAELFSRQAAAQAFHWISGQTPAQPLRCKVKLRYRHAEQWASVTPVGDDGVDILFDEPQRAITPGQAAVLYDGDTVLGGGVICRSRPVPRSIK